MAGAAAGHDGRTFAKPRSDPTRTARMDPGSPVPRRLRRCVAPGDAAEREALTDVAGALVEIAVDRSQLAGAVQPRDGRPVGPHDLAPLVPPRPALRVEH